MNKKENFKSIEQQIRCGNEYFTGLGAESLIWWNKKMKKKHKMNNNPQSIINIFGEVN